MTLFQDISDNQSTNLNLEEMNLLATNETDPSSMINLAAETFKDRLVMSTSFGIYSAVMLHLVTKIVPDIPVIWIDTGYNFPETYQFAENLLNRFDFNIHIYKSHLSPDDMETQYGKLWENNDVASIKLYNNIRKVEPMHRALQELKVKAWLSGLRSHQTNYRKTLSPVNLQGKIYKILPILHWTSEDMYNYLKDNNLPYHPLFDSGYTTIGDWHSSRPVTSEDINERDSRFLGLEQECGLHYLSK